MARHKKIIERVSEVYKWIEARQLANKAIAGQCDACGKCCDFESYDHRLYVTTPEIIFFVEKLGIANIKQMVTGRCCYQSAVGSADGETSPKGGVDRKCSVHAYRFSGCRIFCCKSRATFQSELTESAIKKFKALCAELQIPYRYLELPAALKEASLLCQSISK